MIMIIKTQLLVENLIIDYFGYKMVKHPLEPTDYFLEDLRHVSLVRIEYR